MKTTRTVSTVTAGTVAVVTTFALTACGDGSASSTSSAASDYDGDIGTTDLSSVCPSTVVVQTDWFPEAEHGHLYEQLNYGGEGRDAVTIDAEGKVVSGPLFDGDNGYTGVDLEIRSGGPAIGNQNVTSQMYQDPDILLGYVDTDQSIQNSDGMPTTGVMTTLDKSPQMIMWDPETYPDVHEIADLKGENTTVLTFSNMSYIRYLTGAGILDESQIDESYDGSPATFVAADGANAQQGYSSSEPYNYENEVQGWMKPVDYQLIHDAGFPTYKSALAAKTADLEDAATTDCLSELVPVLQRGVKSYMEDPAATNELIVEAVADFNAGWVYGDGNAEYGHRQMLDEELVADGTDGVLGSFDEVRLNEVLDIVTPIFDEQNTPVKDGVATDELATNEFLDESVSLS
ncbi:ABC transporter substrate-binding protein [Corynebacterium glyciniphilum]|uniref:ABC transporter substrate-binding protein n=1 Tax=Corynebacterium glyciniphilum TaxID=1404244 RepID=UPI0011AB8713|nr:ABC transporter substrate-binding protein [Corynebacterium glyciniphilum]